MSAALKSSTPAAVPSSADLRPVPVLPPRHYVATSRTTGRQFIDDGSNFVCWVDAHPNLNAAIAYAWDALREREEAHRAYAAARAAAMATNPAGWAHADCSHADGICTA